MEWIDPKQADIVAALKRAQAAHGGTAQDPRPVRGFIVPKPA